MTSISKLSPKEKKILKAKAHHLNPIIIIGQNGLTQPVLDEIEIALEHHELIKIKANQHDKEDCNTYANEVCQSLKAEFIGRIGKTLIIYRKKQNSKKKAESKLN